MLEPNLWREENWAISLGALLTGKALEAYTRLSEDAMNYQELKNALLKRYNLRKKGITRNSGNVDLNQRKLDQFIFRIKLPGEVG